MNPQSSRYALEAKLIKKMWSDEAFRAEFEANPQKMMCAAFNLPADQAPKVVLHAESQGEWHIVVPAQPAATSELTDAELERVAGGTVVALSVVTYFGLDVVSEGVLTAIGIDAASAASAAAVTAGDDGW